MAGQSVYVITNNFALAVTAPLTVRDNVTIENWIAPPDRIAERQKFVITVGLSDMHAQVGPPGISFVQQREGKSYAIQHGGRLEPLTLQRMIRSISASCST
jgi:hypothetical protein